MQLDSFLPQIQQAADRATAEWLLHSLIMSAMIAARIGGMVAATPSLMNGVPVRFRVLLVASIAMVLAPNVIVEQPIHSLSMPWSELVAAVVREVIFGMIIGGVVQLLITGIGLAGELIANATGMQLAQSADPSTGEPVPQHSRFLGLMVTTILFAIGGHRLLINALLKSFDRVPPLGVSIDASMTAMVIDHLALGIESGLRVAAPVVACILLTNLAVALISRTVPQLNVLAVGMNINLLAALIVMAVTIGSAGLVFETELTAAIDRISTGE